MKERNGRQLAPLPDPVQGSLRRQIREARSGEEAARALQLPLSAVLSGAAGARLLPVTRRRITAALERAARRRAPGLVLVGRELSGGTGDEP
jgi:hypothetical protein